MAGVALDDGEIGQERRQYAAAVGFGGLQDHLAEACDHVKRRAQFMADVGDELLFDDAGVLGGRDAGLASQR